MADGGGCWSSRRVKTRHATTPGHSTQYIYPHHHDKPPPPTSLPQFPDELVFFRVQLWHAVVQASHGVDRPPAYSVPLQAVAETQSRVKADSAYEIANSLGPKRNLGVERIIKSLA